MSELKQAIGKYEKASAWIDNASPEDVDKHYERYLEVIEHARKVMDEYVKELGYNPYTNYEELKAKA